MAESEKKKTYPIWLISGVVGVVIGTLGTLFLTKHGIVLLCDAIGRLLDKPFVQDHAMWFFAYACTTFALIRMAKAFSERAVVIGEKKHQVGHTTAPQRGG